MSTDCQLCHKLSMAWPISYIAYRCLLFLQSDSLHKTKYFVFWSTAVGITKPILLCHRKCVHIGHAA